MQSRILCLGLVILFGPFRQSVAATWIEYYDGDSDIYQLERSGKRLPVMVYRELRKDDRISVREEGFTLWLKQDDGNMIVVNRGNSPYRVKDSGVAPGILGRLLEYAGEFLGVGLEDGSARPPIVTLGTRGQDDGILLPLTFPLVPSGNARLVSGSRQLHLYWQGGLPPFSLRLQRQGGDTPLLDITSVSLAGPMERRISLGPLELIEGHYELKVGSHSREVIINLEVVSLDALPASPAGLGPNERDALKANVYAVWLASRGEEWVLEAYQSARAIGSMHKPAKVFQHSLENGRRPVRKQ